MSHTITSYVNIVRLNQIVRGSLMIRRINN